MATQTQTSGIAARTRTVKVSGQAKSVYEIGISRVSGSGTVHVLYNNG
jgi:hypothetical protein